ncbi:putative porin POR2 NDAI_0B03710 [Naumovozyma dairenensis CBS 421]|uniref:Mitochondrial outer membrane protein porin n=1 Tax=Naumovozyma dairenensis (strain ATCC 10597 / BCRC 20456 / CBS 421 / NBRC 0211 / NRRL Y-12639) TaxID=1071378 RepID=G0W6J4_NAUDC|nr:hypothetical protein NDAI_0B03710 [Naumovozyma dairenensis CBS 421]CCD23405.1 hypothetical protein NDAI_0B03710 [Naumovozyma dairenensis CBS 421]
MAPPFFPDISKNINNLLNNDFYHSTPAAIKVNTTTNNGVKFTVNAKQPVKEGALQADVESKFFEKTTGVTLTQGWSNQNRLNTKIELASLAPGLKSELITSYTPSVGAKNAKVNMSFVQPFFAAKGTFDIFKSPLFIGNLTLAHEGVVGGAEFGYDITGGTISRYALCLGYSARDYNLALSINDARITSASFYQSVSKILQVGAKATLNPQRGSNVGIEFATKYNPDPTSQIKAKINDGGLLTLSYKQDLRPGITLGVGTSLDALKLDEPIHKLGWSLTFSA